MMKGGQDGVAIFEAAIAALEQEAVDLERRAVATRALLQQLRAHAGSVTTPRSDQPSKAIPPRQFPQGNSTKAAPGGQQVAKAPVRTQPAPVTNITRAKPEIAVVELKKLATEVSRLEGLIKAEKNAAAVKDHIAKMLRAERRGGEVLVALAGKVKDLPVSDLQRRRWRRVTALPPKKFEAELEYRAKLAIAALDPKPPDVNSVPPKRPSLGPGPPEVKLTEWRQDETGALSRELTAT